MNEHSFKTSSTVHHAPVLPGLPRQSLFIALSANCNLSLTAMPHGPSLLADSTFTPSVVILVTDKAHRQVTSAKSMVWLVDGRVD